MIELARHWPFQPQRIQPPNDDLFGPGALVWTGSAPNVVTQAGIVRSAAIPQYKGRGFGKLGVSGAWNAASGDGLRFPNWRPDITSAMTCFVVAAPVSGSSSAETAFALSSDAGSFGRYPSVTFQFNVNSYGSLGYTGQVTLACVNTSSEFSCWAYDGGIDGGVHCWSCSIDTTDSYMLRDGVDITYPGAGQPYSGTMTRPEQQFFIGAHPTFDGARPMTSPLYMVAIVPRKMAKAEAARISQLLLRNLGVGFSKRPKRVFVSAGGSSPSTISAASGSSTASTLTGSATASATPSAAAGVSTASALVGSSVAVATIGAASGASTASAIAGQSVTVATISAAAGASTASAITGASTAVATPSQAAGVSTASAITGASTAASTISAAAGVSTASTLAAVTDGSVISAAAGVSTASALTGSSVAVATISAASGAATASSLAGASTAAATIASASGASTASTLTGSNAAGLASIEAAAGASSAQIIVGSSFAVAIMAAASGRSTCATMSGSGGADQDVAYPLRGQTQTFPLTDQTTSALGLQTYPLQGLTQD